MQVPEIRRRSVDSHKGTFGRSLIVGGSRGMTGAPSLSGIAALKSGAGLVTVAVPDLCLDSVAAHNMCYMTVPLAADQSGRVSLAALERLTELSAAANSIGLGPGMARSDDITSVVANVYRDYSGPMVVDADGLNALASMPDGLPPAAGPRILTPHVGEFRRLVKMPELNSNDCRNTADRFAASNKVIVVLKGPGTLVTDGIRQFVNTTGNPGMATGGSGDVLTGIITSLLGQGYCPMDAAALGVHVHGMAGDLAAESVGQISMTATDILQFLPKAFQLLDA